MDDQTESTAVNLADAQPDEGLNGVVGTVEEGMEDAGGTPVDVANALADNVGNGDEATPESGGDTDVIGDGGKATPAAPGSSGKQGGVGYTVYSGFLRFGGTLAWRNNNPGNIRPGTFSNNHGAIGSAFGFAVFPDESTGMDAIVALLRTQTYQSKTIRGAIFLYAPPNDNNDTDAYVNFIRQATGLDPNTAMSSLNADQLNAVAGAIRRMEGWRAGQEYTCSTQNLPAWASTVLGCQASQP